MKRALPFVVIACLACVDPALAAPPGALEQALHGFVQARAATLPGKVSLELGKYPESEKISACTRWEIFLPERARLWGQVSLGARCSEGPGQSLYISARVKIEAMAVLAARHIASGQTISADDLQRQEADLGTFPPDVILNEADAIGRISRATIAPGRPVQEGLLRQEAVIEAGQTVRVILDDGMLSVSNEGVAISSANRGQAVRVRLPGGRIITGIATSEGKVEIRP